MATNEAKLESYVKRLFAGEKKRVDSDKGQKKKRISPEDAQGKEVVRRCKAKCEVCDLPYTDPYQFNIHHIDGDPSNPLTRNLTLLCSNCHNTIHGRVNDQIKNYKLTHTKTDAGKTHTQKAPAKPKIVKVNCGSCNGSKKRLLTGLPCEICNGEGKVNVYYPPETCGSCNGTGHNILSGVCRDCRGTGYRNAVPAKSTRSGKS